jgi:hypothetical protein
MGGTFSVTSVSGRGTEIIVGYAEKDEPPAAEAEPMRQINFPANQKTEIA